MTKKHIIYISVTLVILLVIFFLKPTKDENYQFTCGVPYTQINWENIDTTQKLVFNSPFKWDKNNLNVFFTDVSNLILINKTLKIANEWSNAANIKFTLCTDIFDSDIRISFRENRGYLSAIGNSACDSNYIGKTTLWLENLDLRSDEEFRRVVLHEFGHAIGLEHELQSPNSNIQWDSVAVYRYYNTTYQWSKEMVNDFIFSKIHTGEYTRFDPSSIMIYAVPGFLTKNHVTIPWPQNLSSLDKKTINKYYPYKF
jgi:hypothetical protein